MCGIILMLALLSPTLVLTFEGISCGDYKCVNDINVVCDAATTTCQCKSGFIGNARIWCISDTKRICSMMGDPHITTFNNERAFIFLPCTQILTDLTLPGVTGSTGPRLYFKVTAITKEVYQARYAAQLMVIGLYIEMTNFNNNEIDIRLDTNGAWNIKPPYQQVTDYSNQGLNFTVKRDLVNGQTVLNLEEIEVRFRAEDGAVSIEIPANAEPDTVNPGLCNSPSDASTFNFDQASRLGLTYDEYLLFVNTGDIHVDLENATECNRRYGSACSPENREASTVKICGTAFVDENIRECYYNYRNKNGNTVFADYNDCHTEVCAGNNPTTFCDRVIAACGAANKPAGCP